MVLPGHLPAVSQPIHGAIAAHSREPRSKSYASGPTKVKNDIAAPVLSAIEHVNETRIKVPLQQSYSGSRPVIPSSLTSTDCVKLQVHGLLRRLNSTLGTSYTQDTPGVSSLLRDCVSKKYDFGTAYARLRLK
ncbi:hypothetical protein EDD18DRAFT_1346217 [Armillaria luteobubalina]|uniref:Uncharacterized protein n=1 Tax=Armillaria luteobubalina TaxID=153913 RepID=A0AA39TXT6_9AGAR|nr:hypothetical protein EDD18DRAFT_1346217 [Armillaria luteobubalina]